jgi:hypothetical protein
MESAKHGEQERRAKNNQKTKRGKGIAEGRIFLRRIEEDSVGLKEEEMGQRNIVFMGMIRQRRHTIK